jgi:hypothetical protein
VLGLIVTLKVRRLRAASNPALRMTAARAYIAIPLPPTADWRLLRTPTDLPDGYAIVGSIRVGRADLPALPAHAALPSAVLETEQPLCAACPLRRAPALPEGGS